MVLCSKPFIETCAKCKGKHKPYIVKIEGMYYVRCDCNKWDPYFFLGRSEKTAWEQWTLFNRPMKRIGHKKYESDN